MLRAGQKIDYNRAMEIFELIYACGCFFDVMVLILDAIAGVSATRYVKADKTKLDPAARRNRQIMLFLVVFFAVAMTGLLVFKWVSGMNRP